MEKFLNPASYSTVIPKIILITTMIKEIKIPISFSVVAFYDFLIIESYLIIIY